MDAARALALSRRKKVEEAHHKTEVYKRILTFCLDTIEKAADSGEEYVWVDDLPQEVIPALITELECRGFAVEERYINVICVTWWEPKQDPTIQPVVTSKVAKYTLKKHLAIGLGYLCLMTATWFFIIRPL